MKNLIRSVTGLSLVLIFANIIQAQNFVEYPGQNRTYGSHTLNSSWAGGPATVTVSFESDGTLHADGNGISQRTARNTQNFSGPRGAGNPQNFDDPLVVGLYGPRLPIIQQMSSSGSSVLSYSFDSAVNEQLDLFITDVDSSDAVSVRAFDLVGQALDMTEWSLFAEGDLSNFKDTGDVFSAITAPTPTTSFMTDQIQLTAVNDTNYNRSYSILRTPTNQGIGRIDVSFTGNRNSPDRANPNTGSHIYVALSTAVPEPNSGLFLLGVVVAVVARRQR
jgi:hypothetical protein